MGCPSKKLLVASTSVAGVLLSDRVRLSQMWVSEVSNLHRLGHQSHVSWNPRSLGRGGGQTARDVETCER